MNAYRGKAVVPTEIAVTAVQGSDHLFRSLFDCAPDAMFLANSDTGVIEDANQAATKLILRPRQEIVGMHFTELHPKEMLGRTREHFHTHLQQSEGGGDLRPIEHYALRSDGTSVPIEVMATILDLSGDRKLLGIFRDITERRQLEADLRESEKRQLNMEIELKSCALEKANSALSTMLDHARRVEAEIKEQVVANLRHIILPLIDVLKKQKLPPETVALVTLLESNIRGLAHPLAKNLESPLLGLTPREIQLALLIKEGRTSKEVTEKLKLSFQTVQTHRHNLRRKLGILHKKINLQTYLRSEIFEDSFSE